MNSQNQTRLGIFYAFFAFTFWGMIPIYFKSISSVPPMQILMHRIIWSVVFLFFIILFSKNLKILIFMLKNRKIKTNLFFSSIVIALNWLTFIWAVEHGQIAETSLGYYTTPLITIFFSFVFLKEIPSKNQKIAVFIAFLAIVFQVYSLGKFPIVALILAITFPIYGLLRKKLNIQSIPGLFIETLFLFPFALIYLIYLIKSGQNHFGTNFDVSFLLFLAGFITVVPLLAFNSATIRLKLSTIGFFQYIGPSVSLLLAVFVYNESLNFEKLITFCMIWIALFIASLDTIKRKKK